MLGSALTVNAGSALTGSPRWPCIDFMVSATGKPRVSNSRHLEWQRHLTAAIEAKGRFGALATPDVPGTRYISGTGPPGNETAAPTGIESGGKEKEIRDEARTYTRHSPIARWHRLGDITAAALRGPPMNRSEQTVHKAVADHLR